MEDWADIIATDKTDSRSNEAVRFLQEREFGKAFDIYRERAEDGDSLSKCWMGVMYYEGLGVDRRPLKAFELIKESYNPDCPETVFQLGKCHFEGIGTPKNEELGFEMIISAAEAGCSAAENYVAASYYCGDYVDKDNKRSLYWLEKAVSHDNPKALYNMGNFLCDGGLMPIDKPKAIEMWKRSWDLHYVPALGRLGGAYLEGDGCEKNYEQGIECLRNAAQAGDGAAAGVLADFFMRGNRTDDDVDFATKYYKIAYDEGKVPACYELGKIYEKRNPKKACDYFREGHEKGDMRCSFEYAMMKYEGNGTEADLELAFSIMLEGAEMGDAALMGWVGHCYYFGTGVNPDKREARKWFERGHQKRHPYCTFRLAEFYLRGITVPIDEKYGLYLLRKSFEKGEEQAAFRLGEVYEEHPTLKSLPDAIYWYMAGAEKGDVKCMLKLAGHYESGAFITGSEKKAFELYNKAYKTNRSYVAAAEIGRCYEEGIGTGQDIHTAVSWYLKAECHNSFSMWRLYNIYINRGETDRALFWLRRSASNGSVSAMVELARIYEEGKLVPKSDLMATKWYHRAADEGNEHAKARFEELIRYDPQDVEELSEYEREARLIGEEWSDITIINLARKLMNGEGMPQDLKLAKMWYSIGAQLGYSSAKEGWNKVRSMIKAEKEKNIKQTKFE